MKITRENLSKSRVKLTLEESKEQVAKYRKQALESMRQKANIKGFRPGAKISDDILVKHFGEGHIEQMTIEYAIDGLYQEALKKESIMPVSQATIESVSSQDPLTIIIEVEVFPTIEIAKKYKAIKLKRVSFEVTDGDVEGALADIKTRFSRFEKAGEGYTIVSGDRVTIDTEGKNESGDILESTKMKAYPLVIGSGMLVPGFEEGLIGKVAGDIVELPITFPTDYHSTDFAGKKTTFTVHIHSIETSISPEFTPEFIKNLRGKDFDLAGFKALIKEEILETKENNAHMEEENQLMEVLKEVVTIDIGEKMLETQTGHVFNEIKENLKRDQIKVSDYLDSLKLSEEAYKEAHVKPIAEKRLFGELVLHKLMEMEQTKVSDEEMKPEIERILKRFENDEVLTRLKDLYVPGQKYYEELRQRMGYKKLIDTFFE